MIAVHLSTEWLLVLYLVQIEYYGNQGCHKQDLGPLLPKSLGLGSPHSVEWEGGGNVRWLWGGTSWQDSVGGCLDTR